MEDHERMQRLSGRLKMRTLIHQNVSSGDKQMGLASPLIPDFEGDWQCGPKIHVVHE